jgi:hypothetical protein
MTVSGEYVMPAAEAKARLRCTYKVLLGYIDRGVLDVVTFDDDRDLYVTEDSVEDLPQRLEDDPGLLDASIDRFRQVGRAWYEILADASPHEALALLGSRHVNDDARGWVFAEREELWKAKARLAREVDRLDHDPAEKRPGKVPRRAKQRMVMTAIGKVPVWYWAGRTGRYGARHGGPRPTKSHYGPTAQAAVKAASDAARTLYGKPERRTSLRLRFAVLSRDAFTCRYCGRKAPDIEIHIDHIVPVAEGGTNTLDNLCVACRECNAGKADLLL